MPLRRFTLRRPLDAPRFDLFALPRNWAKQAELTGAGDEVVDALWFTGTGLRVALVSPEDVGLPVVVLETLVDTADARAELAGIAGEIEELFHPIPLGEALDRYRSATSPDDRAILLPVLAVSAQPDHPDTGAVGAVREALGDDDAAVRLGAATAARYLPAATELLAPLRRAAGTDPDPDVREAAGSALAATGEPAEEAGSAAAAVEVAAGDPGDRLRRVVLFNLGSAATFAQFATGQGWRVTGNSTWLTSTGVDVMFGADEVLRQDLVTVSGAEPESVARVEARIRAVFPSIAAADALAAVEHATDPGERALALRVLAGAAPPLYDADIYRVFLPFFEAARPSARTLAAGLSPYPGWPQFLPILDWLARADPEQRVRTVAEAARAAIAVRPGTPPATRYYTAAAGDPGGFLARRIAVRPDPVDEELGAGGVWRGTDIVRRHASGDADARLVEISEDEARRLVSGS